jgi:hypothetical protein
MIELYMNLFKTSFCFIFIDKFCIDLYLINWVYYFKFIDLSYHNKIILIWRIKVKLGISLTL